MSEGPRGPRLSRVVRLPGAVLLGLGSIVGTGAFVSIGIAAGVAGPAVLLAIVLAGLLATCNGLSSAQLAAAHPATGETFELNAIAAVVLGGTSLSGGRGGVGGTLIGAFVIGVLSDGLILLGVSEFWQIVIKGFVIVVAVVVDQWASRQPSRAPVQSRSTP